ncbi:nitroreductase [Streptomyces noursei]|uniref:nitroreductase n=1 Tax=Streptomyces noursei TaxID=1971 RepID=UPI00364400F8
MKRAGCLRDPAGPPETSGHVERLIRGRHAVRAFRPDAVPGETMRAIFSLAGSAPSNSNTQPWRVAVASGAVRERLADSLQAAHAANRTSVDFPYDEGAYAPAQLRRRSEFGAQLYGALGIDRDDHPARAAYDAESLRFYGAPHVAFLFVADRADARLAADVGAYLQTLLLAMAGYGVDSCPQGLLSFYADTVRGELGIEAGKLLVGVSFGYADGSAPVNRLSTGRAALEATTTFHG